jgi:hypothetical protein
LTAIGLIECKTDDQLQARADYLLAGSGHAGIEVWDWGRQVH